VTIFTSGNENEEQQTFGTILQRFYNPLAWGKIDFNTIKLQLGVVARRFRGQRVATQARRGSAVATNPRIPARRETTASGVLHGSWLDPQSERRK